MNGWHGHLRSARRATEPDVAAVDRVRRHALAAEAPPDRGRRALPWIAAAAFAGLACVAGWLGAHWRGEPDLALSETLAGPGAVAVSPDVRLAFDGTGSVGGTPRAPEIHWTSGRVHVEVTPARGIALVVDTREARVEVVGTGFDVERSALGTEVSVAHGRVNVRCADASAGSLGPGERMVCLPTTAAAWMGRARALAAAGAADADVLDAIDHGLARCAEPSPELGELLVLRLGVLLDAGRPDEARATAERYLASGATERLAEVRAIAEQLRAR